MRMKKLVHTIAALSAAAALMQATPAPAAPLPATLAVPHASSAVDQVQWRRGWRGGRGIGIGIGAGILGGAIIGSALARPYYYDRPYRYYPRTYYYEPAPTYYAPPPPGADAIQYCMSRFRSYDPTTGTYLGYDGYRHPCP
jgi:hypothetical protein